jgi:hypothetical protein
MPRVSSMAPSPWTCQSWLKKKGLIEEVRERRKDPIRYNVRPLLSKLEPRAKEWMAVRGLEDSVLNPTENREIPSFKISP